MTPFCKCLIIVFVVSTSLPAADPPRQITDSLALQESMRQARDLLIRNESAQAVELLEKQLGKVAGDPAFLNLLRDAYRAHLKELQLANKTETYEIYRKRLAVIDKPINAPPAPTQPPPKPDVVRGARPDDDPFQQVPQNDAKPPNDSLNKAERLFADQKYAEAKPLFAAAAQAGSLSEGHNSQFAYCLIHAVVQRINANTGATEELEGDLKTALGIAPKDGELAKFAEQVQRELVRRGGGASNPPPINDRVAIKHGEGGSGWKLAESKNFKLYHSQSPENAEQLLQLAEQYRTAAITKWSAAAIASWQPVCEVFLHPTGEGYAKATKQPATAPGHSTIKAQNGKVVSRRMDLRADEPNLMGCVLPHEVTHVAIADMFADTQLPRWADEGMAVLSEPRAQVDRYLKTMVRLRMDGKLIPLAQLLTKPEFPDPNVITVFYVESVSVVEFLVGQKGPQQFSAFARDASRGLEPALAKHYGINGVADLQDRWLRATFTEIDKQMGVGGR